MVTNFQPLNPFWKRKWWSNFQSSNPLWINLSRKKTNFQIFFEWTFEEENDSHEFSTIKSFLKKKMMVTNFQPLNPFWRRKWWSRIFNPVEFSIIEFCLDESFEEENEFSNFFWMNFWRRKWWSWIFNPVEFSIIESSLDGSFEEENKFSNSKFFLNEFLKKMVTNFQPSNSLWMNFRRRKWWSWIFNYSLWMHFRRKMMVTNFQSSNPFWRRKWWSRIFNRILFEWRKWWSRISPLNFREKLKRTLEEKMKEESRTRF